MRHVSFILLFSATFKKHSGRHVAHIKTTLILFCFDKPPISLPRHKTLDKMKSLEVQIVCLDSALFMSFFAYRWKASFEIACE